MQRGNNFTRILASAAAVLFLFLQAPVAAAAQSADAPPAGEAQDITAGCSVTFSQGNYAPATVTDANRTTKLQLTGPVAITIENETPIHSLYLIWDQPPAAYTIGAGGETVPGGSFGAMHESIALPAGQTSVTLELADDETWLLCDIYAFAAGSLPPWVQQWQPPCEKADLLLLPTHADDEHLFFGGAMPTYAGEEGLAVQVVYLVHHFGEPYRPHELLNGLWEVGVTAYPVMGPFPDVFLWLDTPEESLAAADRAYGREAVTAYVTENLRRFKPEVVIGHDLNGEYGHGAHMIYAHALLDALEQAADEAAQPESLGWGAWDTPKAYLHLYGENPITMDWDAPLAHFGGATAFEMAVAGFAKHASQQNYFAVEEWGPYDCRLFGLARSTVGPDVAGGDFFENIDPARLSTAPPPVASAPDESAVDAADETPDADSISIPDGAILLPFSQGHVLIAVLLVGVLLPLGLVGWIVYANRKPKKKDAPKGKK